MDKDEKRAEFLQTLRKKKGLTQQELAEMVHYSDKNVSKWETGKSFPTNPNVILKLAEIFEVSFEELMYGEFKTETNEEKIADNVKKEYVKSYNKYSKTIKRIFVGVLLLTIVFLVSIYFIYIKNSVYYYSANIKYGHERNKITLLITNKINIFNFNKLDDPEEKISKVSFYYKNGEEEKNIFYGDNDDYYISEKHGYNSNEFEKLVKSECYLKIKYNDGTEEKISVQFKNDYINDNVFPKEFESNPINDNNKVNDIIKRLQAIGFQHENNYYIKNISPNIICRYYDYEKRLEIVITKDNIVETLHSYEDDKTIFYERLEDDMPPESKTFDEEGKMNCDNQECKTVEDFAKYINYLRY